MKWIGALAGTAAGALAGNMLGGGMIGMLLGAVGGGLLGSVVQNWLFPSKPEGVIGSEQAAATGAMSRVKAPGTEHFLAKNAEEVAKIETEKKHGKGGVTPGGKLPDEVQITEENNQKLMDEYRRMSAAGITGGHVVLPQQPDNQNERSNRR